MNDPHIASLTYRVLESDTYEFADNAPDLIVDTPDFSGTLSHRMLTLTPKKHFASEAEIRPLADAFVRAWEIGAGLADGRPNFTLRFDGSQIIDRNPPPGVLLVGVAALTVVGASVQVKVTRHTYPAPPREFRATPLVETLWVRFCRYVDGQEPLLAMAYFCLDLLESGDRRMHAARRLGIEQAILRKLGELTAKRGDDLTARKAEPDRKPLSGEERVWIETAIKKIVRHLATRQPGITLMIADLPPL